MTVEWKNPPGLAPAQGLYSQAGLATGKLAFIAGQLSVGNDGALVGPHDFEAQFHQVVSNLGAVLNGLGSDWRRVVKFTTFLVHSQDIETFMRLRREVFPTLFGSQPYPPNTLLVVDRLVQESFLFELEAIAELPA